MGVSKAMRTKKKKRRKKQRAFRAVYKTGTGTRGRGHWDAWGVVTRGRETRDLGTSSMGRGDEGRQIQGRGGNGDVNE